MNHDNSSNITGSLCDAPKLGRGTWDFPSQQGHEPVRPASSPGRKKQNFRNKKNGGKDLTFKMFLQMFDVFLKHISTKAYFFFSLSRNFENGCPLNRPKKSSKFALRGLFWLRPDSWWRKFLIEMRIEAWSILCGSILSAASASAITGGITESRHVETPEPSLSISQKSDSFALRSTGLGFPMFPGCAQDVPRMCSLGSWNIMKPRVPFQLTTGFLSFLSFLVSSATYITYVPNFTQCFCTDRCTDLGETLFGMWL